MKASPVCVSIQENEMQQPLYVHLSEYNLLKTDNEKLKLRIDKLIKDKKNLEAMVEDMIKNYQLISEKKKNTDLIIEKLQTNIKSINLNKLNQPKSEYSTTSSYIEYISTKNNSNKVQTMSEKEKENLVFSNLQSKVFRELETTSRKISEGLENLVAKYNIREEDLKSNDLQCRNLLKQINLVNSEYNLVISEFNEKQETSDRLKEIDRSLLDYIINSLVLNFNNDNQEELGNSSNKNNSQLVCEPVPTFVRFINNGY